MYALNYVLERHAVLLAAAAEIPIAVGVDILLGHPRAWPGLRFITRWLAKRYGSVIRIIFGRGRGAGTLYLGALLVTILAAYGIVDRVCASINPAAPWIFHILIIYETLGARDLDGRVRAVLRPLSDGDLDEARRRLAKMIPGNAEGLDEPGISGAAVALSANGLNDALVAPLFWAALLGAPGVLIFRVVCILDSVGEDGVPESASFGEATGRTGRFLRRIPARLTAIAIAGADWFRLWERIREEASERSDHDSAWAEAAMAFGLNIRLKAADSHGDSGAEERKVFHSFGRLPGPNDVRLGLRIIWKAGALVVAVATVVCFFRAVLAAI